MKFLTAVALTAMTFLGTAHDTQSSPGCVSPRPGVRTSGGTATWRPPACRRTRGASPSARGSTHHPRTRRPASSSTSWRGSLVAPPKRCRGSSTSRSPARRRRGSAGTNVDDRRARRPSAKVATGPLAAWLTCLSGRAESRFGGTAGPTGKAPRKVAGMNKTQLAAAVAERTGASPADARRQVDAVLDSISTAVASGERVTLLGFGTFEGAARAARTARNPRTGSTIDVPAAVVPRFRVGAAFKARVGEGAPAPVVTGTASADPGERQGARPSTDSGTKVPAKPARPGARSPPPRRRRTRRPRRRTRRRARRSRRPSPRRRTRRSPRRARRRSSTGRPSTPLFCARTWGFAPGHRTPEADR
ncbi:HU family DNA-binding protein [Isoptericola jiangsuensis]|uniref:HU family DNA-binding protein n=1 Tax=Isoptericola jiangsuensis TaxID=548579 RepID=UPI003AACE7E5